MVIWLASKTVIKFLSQSVPFEMIGLVRCGNMWERMAASGRFVCGRSAIWVEEMISQVCKVMGMGWYALVLLIHGVLAVM